MNSTDTIQMMRGRIDRVRVVFTMLHTELPLPTPPRAYSAIEVVDPDSGGIEPDTVATVADSTKLLA